MISFVNIIKVLGMKSFIVELFRWIFHSKFLSAFFVYEYEVPSG